MTFPTLGNNCADGGVTGCAGLRILSVQCLGSNDGVNANMNSWANDFDMTTIPWGNQYYYTFSDNSLTAPDNLSSGGLPNIYPIGFTSPAPSLCDLVDSSGAPLGLAESWRTQTFVPSGMSYGVIAFTVGDQTGWFACTGTVPVCGQTLEIPIPNDSLSGGAPWNRMHYWGVPGLTAANVDSYFKTNINPTLPTGGTWDPTATCHASPADPFDGDDP